MSKEKKVYTSIFDAVSEMEQDKTSKKIDIEKMEEAKASSGPQEGVNSTDQELKKSFDQYKKLHDLMHDKVEALLGQKQLTRRMLHDFFSVPRNFTSEQWKLVQDQKEEVEKQLRELLPTPEQLPEENDQKEKDPNAPLPAKPKAGKEYKPKVMQVKSRWIPMR